MKTGKIYKTPILTKYGSIIKNTAGSTGSYGDGPGTKRPSTGTP